MSALKNHCKKQLRELIGARLNSLEGFKLKDEAALLQEPLKGYDPKCDLMLSFKRNGIDAHIWIELEYRRADPVANPAKFLVAFKEPRATNERHFLVCALTSGIEVGRRALCDQFVHYLNESHVQLSAKQVLLFRDLNKADVIRLSKAKSVEFNEHIKTALGKTLERGLVDFVDEIASIAEQAPWDSALTADRE